MASWDWTRSVIGVGGLIACGAILAGCGTPQGEKTVATSENGTVSATPVSSQDQGSGGEIGKQPATGEKSSASQANIPPEWPSGWRFFGNAVALVSQPADNLHQLGEPNWDVVAGEGSRYNEYSWIVKDDGLSSNPNGDVATGGAEKIFAFTGKASKQVEAIWCEDASPLSVSDLLKCAGVDASSVKCYYWNSGMGGTTIGVVGTAGKRCFFALTGTDALFTSDQQTDFASGKKTVTEHLNEDVNLTVLETRKAYIGPENVEFSTVGGIEGFGAKMTDLMNINLPSVKIPLD